MVSNAWEFVKIRQFEHVAAGPSIALLRVSGKLPRRRSGSGQRPTLVADDGRSVQRFAAVASPPDGRGILRTAYSVPIGTLTPDTVFSLETGEGFVIALPSPTPWTGDARRGEAPSRRRQPAAAQPAAVVGADAEADAARGEEHWAELVRQLAETSSALALAQRLGAEREAGRAGAEADAAQVREQMQALGARVAELERGAAQASEQIAAAEELNESLEQRNVALDETVRQHREQIQALEGDLDGVVRAHAELERETEALRAARARDEAEVEQARDSLRKIAIERDEINRQAAAFDGVAVKARQRATLAETASEESAAALRELETWRGELERRLTSTTTELSAARAAAQEDERERKRLRGELAEAEAMVELAQAEIANLNDRLARGRERAPESVGAEAGERRDPAAEAQIESIRASAEADAREQAERELAAADARPEFGASAE